MKRVIVGASLVVLACGSGVPSSFPKGSAASPDSPAAPLPVVASAIDREPQAMDEQGDASAAPVMHHHEGMKHD